MVDYIRSTAVVSHFHHPALQEIDDIGKRVKRKPEELNDVGDDKEATHILNRLYPQLSNNRIVPS